MKKYEYVVSLLILVSVFLLFYSETSEWMGSLLAAVLTAALTTGSMIMIRWLVEVFTKKT